MLRLEVTFAATFSGTENASPPLTNRGSPGVNFALFCQRSVHPSQPLSAKICSRAADHEEIAMSFRRDFITKPIFSWARGVLPAMSDTEREALEAGDVWWDADLFTGNPDWSKLLANAPATLTDEEKAFLHGPGRRTLRHARRLEDQLGMARPAAGGLGLHQAPQILRHDHPEGIWRARLLALCAFRSGAKAFVALADRRRHRDGAEFARARRTPDALRHQGAAAAMAAAARRWPRHSLLRPDQPRSRLGRRVDDRHRHHLQGQFRGPRSARAAAQLAQALHHARAGRDAARSRLQGL